MYMKRSVKSLAFTLREKYPSSSNKTDVLLVPQNAQRCICRWRCYISAAEHITDHTKHFLHRRLLLLAGADICANVTIMLIKY